MLVLEIYYSRLLHVLLAYTVIFGGVAILYSLFNYLVV
jgi:hypothetical protein